MAQHEQGKSTKPSQGAATRIPGWKTGMFHFAALPLGRSARRTTHHTITKSWHKRHKTVLKTWLKQNLRQVSGVDVPLSVSKQRLTSHSLHHQGSARAHSVSPVVQSMCVFLEKKQLYLEKELLNCSYTARVSVSQPGSKTNAV